MEKGENLEENLLSLRALQRNVEKSRDSNVYMEKIEKNTDPKSGGRTRAEPYCLRFCSIPFQVEHPHL